MSCSPGCSTELDTIWLIWDHYGHIRKVEINVSAHSINRRSSKQFAVTAATAGASLLESSDQFNTVTACWLQLPIYSWDMQEFALVKGAVTLHVTATPVPLTCKHHHHHHHHVDLLSPVCSSGGSTILTNSTLTWISTPRIRHTFSSISWSWRIPERHTHTNTHFICTALHDHIRILSYSWLQMGSPRIKVLLDCEWLSQRQSLFCCGSVYCHLILWPQQTQYSLK